MNACRVAGNQAKFSKPCVFYRPPTCAVRACLQPQSRNHTATQIVHTQPILYGGLCMRCGQYHSLPASKEALYAAQAVADSLDTHKRFDYESAQADPDFSTDYVWTKGPGRMLGVLVCLDRHAQEHVVLKAFRCAVSGGSASSTSFTVWLHSVDMLRIADCSHSHMRIQKEDSYVAMTAVGNTLLQKLTCLTSRCYAPPAASFGLEKHDVHSWSPAHSYLQQPMVTSGQMTRRWECPGWAGPVASITHTSPVYKRHAIESLTQALEQLHSCTDSCLPQPVSTTAEDCAASAVAASDAASDKTNNATSSLPSLNNNAANTLSFGTPSYSPSPRNGAMQTPIVGTTNAGVSSSNAAFLSVHCRDVLVPSSMIPDKTAAMPAAVPASGTPSDEMFALRQSALLSRRRSLSRELLSLVLHSYNTHDIQGRPIKLLDVCRGWRQLQGSVVVSDPGLRGNERGNKGRGGKIKELTVPGADADADSPRDEVDDVNTGFGRDGGALEDEGSSLRSMSDQALEGNKVEAGIGGQGLVSVIDGVRDATSTKRQETSVSSTVMAPSSEVNAAESSDVMAAGTGDCAAIKLLHAAASNPDLQPVCLVEF
eukprot:scaffold119746_cov18-Tisochrysis_lutea.AAC.1